MAGGRDTIKQRIALDGGEAIRQELAELGKVGEAALRKLQKAASDMKGPDNSFVAKLQQIKKELEATGKAVTKFGEQVKGIGKSMTAALSLPIAGMGVGVLKVAGDFESGMIRVQAATQASGAELQKLEDLARKLGKETSFGPRDMALAMEALAKNGLDATQILNGAAEAAVKLASAFDSDLNATANIVTDVMQSFGKTAAEIPGLIDGISGTLQNGKLEMDDYRLAIGQAGGIAAALGVSFEDFNTALAGTANQFASGADAGTSFKTFLQRLSPDTEKATGVVEKFGLRFFEASGKLRPMAEIAEELRRKIGQLSDQAKQDVLGELFGTDAIRTAIGLMKQGEEGLTRIDAAISKVSANQLAEARMAGFNGQMKQLIGSLEDLAITIGKSGLLEGATDLVKGLTGLVDVIATFSPGLLKWATILALVTAAIGPLLFSVGMMATGLGAMITAAGKITGAFSAILVAVEKLSPRLLALAGVPARVLLGWAALAIGLIVYWDDILDGARQFYEGLFGDPSQVTSGWIVAWTGAIENFVSAIGSALTGDFSGAWEKLKEAGTQVFNSIREGASGNFGAIVRDAGLAWVAIRVGGVAAAAAVRIAFTALSGASLFGGIAAGAGGLLSGALALLLSWPALLVAAFVAAAAGIVFFWDEIKSGADAVWEGLKSGVEFIGKGFAALWRELGIGSAEASETAKGELSEIGNAGAVDALATAFNAAFAEMKAASTETAQFIVTAFAGIIPQVGGLVEALVLQTEAALLRLETRIQALQAAVIAAAEIAAASAGGVDAIAAFTALETAAVAVFDRLRASAAQAASDIAAAFSQFAVDWTLTTAGADEAWATIRATAEETAQRVQEAFAGISVDRSVLAVGAAEAAAAVQEPFVALVQQIQSVFQQITASVKAAMDQAVQLVQAAADKMGQTLAALETRIKNLAKQAAELAKSGSSSSSSGGTTGFATGGCVVGPGSATSDSILARLSNGEFVIRAAAVRKYGARFFDMLNRMQVGRSKLPAFATGGPVKMPAFRMPDLPGFAQGGLAQLAPRSTARPVSAGAASSGRSWGTPLTLVLGGETFAGLAAPEETAKNLMRYATSQQIRSAGRKPSWY